MSLTHKMFACFVLIVVLAVFARAIPVPVPEEAQPGKIYFIYNVPRRF